MGGEKSLLLIPFVGEVVNSCHLIVLIIIYTFLCIVGLESKLLNHFKNFGLGWDRVLAYYQSLVLADWLKLLEPPMLSDVFCCEASLWVSVQNF